MRIFSHLARLLVSRCCSIRRTSKKYEVQECHNGVDDLDCDTENGSKYRIPEIWNLKWAYYREILNVWLGISVILKRPWKGHKCRKLIRINQVQTETKPSCSVETNTRLAIWESRFDSWDVTRWRLIKCFNLSVPILINCWMSPVSTAIERSRGGNSLRVGGKPWSVVGQH